MSGLPSPQQLRYLVALAECEHFGHAAAACEVTQGTLSAGILALERQIDAPLLERTGGKKPVFTPLGRDLVARARAVLATLTEFMEAVDASREPLSGPLRLGTIPTIGPFLLPRLMPRLRTAFPRLRLFLREDPVVRLAEALAAARLDVLLVALPCDCGEVETLAIAEDPFLVALPPGHALALQQEIRPAALAGERLMLLEDGHCLRDHALSACPGAGLLAAQGAGASSLHTLAQMVAGGLAVTLLPRLAVAGGVTAGTGIALRPMADGFARRIGLAWRARSPRAEAFRRLAPAIAEALAER
jgi:LysR family hydrogen peroxide-inducible transcriptional activator